MIDDDNYTCCEVFKTVHMYRTIAKSQPHPTYIDKNNKYSRRRSNWNEEENSTSIVRIKNHRNDYDKINTLPVRNTTVHRPW